MKTLITEYRTDSGEYTVQIFKTAEGWRVENSIGEAHLFHTEDESESFSEGWIHNQNYLPNTVELEPTSLRMRK